MNDQVEKIISLIQASALDQTIKDILIRDLKTEGLTEFLKEQIKVYCLEGLKLLDEAKKEALQLLEEKESQTDQAA